MKARTIFKVIVLLAVLLSQTGVSFVATSAPAPVVDMSATGDHNRPTESVQAETSEPLTPLDTYTISGRVTDSAGNPVQGVTITATRIPIVFVHGFRGVGLPVGCTDNDKTRLTLDSEIDDYFASVDDLLKDDYPVYYAHLVSSPCYTPSLVSNARNLRDSINRAKNETKASKVILIAHSMGGLISRAYIENNSLYQYDVAALFTFGSPHQGVLEDVLKSLLTQTALGYYCEQFGPAACEFSSLGTPIFNQTYSARRNGVNYYVISGDMPLYTRGALGILTSPLIAGPDDGIVGTDSGTGLSGNVRSHRTDENHNAFGSSLYDWTYFGIRKTFLQTDTDSKSYTQCLKPILVDGTSSSCLSTYAPVSASATAEIPELPERTPLVISDLPPGQTVTTTLQLEGGATLFASSWSTGTLAMRLKDPGGVIIDPAFAAANPTVVTYTVGTTAASYYFPSASGGEWKLALQEVTLPPVGTSTVSFAAFESPLTFDGGTDQAWYAPGDTAVIPHRLVGVLLRQAIGNALQRLADGALLARRAVLAVRRVHPDHRHADRGSAEQRRGNRQHLAGRRRIAVAGVGRSGRWSLPGNI